MRMGLPKLRGTRPRSRPLNLAIDGKFRGCDVVSLKIDDMGSYWVDRKGRQLAALPSRNATGAGSTAWGPAYLAFAFMPESR